MLQCVWRSKDKFVNGFSLTMSIWVLKILKMAHRLVLLLTEVTLKVPKSHFFLNFNMRKENGIP